MAAPGTSKQNYLCDEVLDKGYDPEDFMNFMAEAKEDGTNIDVWTLAELEKVVQEYKQRFSSNGEGQHNNQNQNSNADQDQPESQNNNSKTQ